MNKIVFYKHPDYKANFDLERILPKTDRIVFKEWNYDIGDPSCNNFLLMNVLDLEKVRSGEFWNISDDLYNHCLKSNIKILLSTNREFISSIDFGNKKVFPNCTFYETVKRPNIYYLSNVLDYWCNEILPSNYLRMDNFAMQYRYAKDKQGFYKKEPLHDPRRFKMSVILGYPRPPRAALLYLLRHDCIANNPDVFYSNLPFEDDTELHGDNHSVDMEVFDLIQKAFPGDDLINRFFYKKIEQTWKTPRIAEWEDDEIPENWRKKFYHKHDVSGAPTEWSVPEPMDNSYFTVFVETRPEVTSITEKFWKPIIAGIPAIWFAGPNMTQYLLDNGYKLFPRIDYSFDKELNYHVRYKKFYRELQRLYNIHPNNWERYLEQHKDVLIHNQEHFYNQKEKDIERFCTAL